MAQFDVYRNTNIRSKDAYPYLVDVQANLLDTLRTRVMIPLASAPALQNQPIDQLTPVITAEGSSYVLLTPQLSGIPQVNLGQPVTNISVHRDDIIRALDLLFTGI